MLTLALLAASKTRIGAGEVGPQRADAGDDLGAGPTRAALRRILERRQHGHGRPGRHEAHTRRYPHQRRPPFEGPESVAKRGQQLEGSQRPATLLVLEHPHLGNRRPAGLVQGTRAAEGVGVGASRVGQVGDHVHELVGAALVGDGQGGDGTGGASQEVGARTERGELDDAAGAIDVVGGARRP
jgi:hypothetical protein